MRPLRRLSPVPPKLENYAKENPQGTWEKFSKKPKRKKTVFNVLCDMQHGLCAYCEIDIADYDRQVEHFFPKSKTEEAGSTNKHLEWDNMLLCCRGGNLQGEKKASAHRLRAEFRISDTDTYSCGKLKDDTVFDECLNPYNWKYPLVKMHVIPLGETHDNGASLAYELRLVPWEEHCKHAGIKPDDIQNFVDALNLNGARLLHARGEAYQQRVQIAKNTPDNQIHQYACDYLLPRSSRLPRFVSVSSHLLGAFGSKIVLRYTLLGILNHIKNNKKKS